MIKNLSKYFDEFDKRKGHFHVHGTKRVARALGLSESSVYRVLNDRKGVLQPLAGADEERGAVQTRPKKYDDFTMGVIRRRVMRCFREKETVTVDRLVELLNSEVDDINFTKSSVWRALKIMGFKFKKTKDDRKKE